MRVVRLIFLGVSGALCALFWPICATAHDVSALKVVVGVDADRLEINQTLSLSAAKTILERANLMPKEADISDEGILSAMFSGWRVTSETGDCILSRQAYKRSHHGTQITLRYLVICPKKTKPTRLDLAWLAHIPDKHFLVFELKKGETSQTKMFERQFLQITLE